MATTNINKIMTVTISGEDLEKLYLSFIVC